ncbi:FG-GAP-like repeat-containing protein [Flavobacteriaceae bacterium F89]|uniref:FG-GAP-like repeat-containing protein n=1 Tax=Cerina litoralis TaxID=2874477 RepID=A0AAE3EU80_9FLAO|nr:FG-GAP-like repeat-containing protein [Cerina litoralis]MCG2460354.1 FG-GAP-like repeat-containing protein [Cerina litoralis]
MKPIKLTLFVLVTALLLYGCTKESKTLFKKIEASESGLNFSNQLTESDSLNILVNEFVYNGAGVAVGDVNGDGLEDLFMAGNQVENKLFLNRGKLRFKDISDLAGIQKPDTLNWSAGVTMIDLNLDGKLDIYVCNTLRKEAKHRKNLLYINQGNNADGVPSFKEMGEEYGIADDSHSSHAQFFDYDNDGDLDLFIGVNRIEGINPSVFRLLTDDEMAMSRDKLFENIQNDSLGHPHFKDVTLQANIRYNGFSHSSLINDFNGDGWLDIYVANDYLTSDLIYINNQDGTFTNKARGIFKHYSLSAMGSDVSDINNDGRMDFFTTEMQPYYNKRKKLFQGGSSYEREMLIQRYDYERQYTRNTLQLNLGTNPETGLPIFSEIGMYAGVEETDWSWAALFADYDNDGWSDLLVVNGFPRDVMDHDFGDFRESANRLISQKELIEAIPEIKTPNFIFKNNGDLTFKDVTEEWGFNFKTYSNGAAYGDLDNDGDIDLVLNNLNGPMILLENRGDKIVNDSHYLRVKLSGTEQNRAAIGATVEVFYDNLRQIHSVLSTRGYLSKSENTLHFGLGKSTFVDSLKVTWPGGRIQKIGKTEGNREISIAYKAQDLDIPTTKNLAGRTIKKKNALFSRDSVNRNLAYEDRDKDFIDFNFQRTLPHKFSQFGPSLAVGDVNVDGLDDMLVGASRGFKERWFLQQPNGHFVQNEVGYKNSPELHEEDAGTLLFDADNDGDLDLYIVRGSAQYNPGSDLYKDMLLLNDGDGNFVESKEGTIPKIMANGSCVKAADYDQDGDLDLFVGSRVLPMAYPKPDRSFILRNDGNRKDGPHFVDATEDVSAELAYPGMISDALWTDFNGDSWPDLILVGEWMPIRIFENKQGSLVEITQTSGLEDYLGWWNSLAAADLDNDGDIDYVVGNNGKNNYFQGTKEEPLRLYAKDLDNNGSIDPFITYYLRDSIGVRHEYLYHPWQDVVKQFSGIRKMFNSYGAFGASTAPEMFANGLMDNATVLSANWMSTSWIENLGHGKFKMHALPKEAQLAPVFGILPMDFDNDNNIDILLVGNDYGMEVQQGRADAMVGLALRNNGKGGFTALGLDESNFFVPGDAKSLVSLNLAGNKSLIIASQNRDSLKIIDRPNPDVGKVIRLKPKEVKCQLKLENGKVQIHEFYLGSTFQSQSSRTITVGKGVKEIRFLDNFGKETRKLEF